MASDARDGTHPAAGAAPAGERAPAIALERLSLRFGGPHGILALDALDLVVPEREVVAIIGPNGCGKSTLLREIGRAHV